MGNLGAGEFLFIAIFALLVFGPKRLPEIGRSVGKALAELRKATNELKDGFTAGFDDLGEPLILNGPIKATRVTPQIPPVPPAEPATPAPGRTSSPAEAGFPPDPSSPSASGEDGAAPR